MLYELLLDARTAARKKGLITSGKKVFVRVSYKHFIIQDNKGLTYRHLLPLYFQTFFPQKNRKESGSYQLGYLISILYALKRHGEACNFCYTSETLEFKSSRFSIKLNSVESRIQYRIKVIKDRIDRGDKTHLDPCNPNNKPSLPWLNETKPRLIMELNKLKKEYKDL